MASRIFKGIFLGATVLTLGGTLSALWLDNARLRRGNTALKNQHQQAEHLWRENRELQEIVTRAESAAGDGARGLHEGVVRTKLQVEELERKARADYERLRVERAGDNENLANNRDPERGLVRLENFENRGQATPAAAFQTFVWSAMKGEDAMLANLISMDETAQEKGKAMIATLPEVWRAKYPTPEKLAAFFFAAALTAQPAAQVVDVRFPDVQHAVVQVRGLTERTQKIPLQLGAQGWQIVVPAGMIDRLGQWATEGSPKSGNRSGGSN